MQFIILHRLSYYRRKTDTPSPSYDRFCGHFGHFGHFGRHARAKKGEWPNRAKKFFFSNKSRFFKKNYHYVLKS